MTFLNNQFTKLDLILRNHKYDIVIVFNKMTPSTVHQYISGGKERNAVIEAKAKRAIQSSIYTV